MRAAREVSIPLTNLSYHILRRCQTKIYETKIFFWKGIDFCKKYDMIVAARKRAVHNNAAWLAAPQGKAGLWRQNAWKR